MKKFFLITLAIILTLMTLFEYYMLYRNGNVENFIKGNDETLQYILFAGFLLAINLIPSVMLSGIFTAFACGLLDALGKLPRSRKEK